MENVCLLGCMMKKISEEKDEDEDEENNLKECKKPPRRWGWGG